MTQLIVLGAGMVGSAMAIDLTKSFNVTIADIDTNALENVKHKCPDLTTQVVDVTQSDQLKEILKSFDLVVCAVPGFLGFNTLKQIIEAKKNVVDISFFPENALELHQLAQENQVTAIVDCGVAPGMGNIILGRYNELLKVTDFECLVGGLPKVKKWPFQYKAPFSPVDVIEEYTRPARYVEHGKMITREALTDVEHEEFEHVGTLESFNSDGLRSLIFTMPHIPNMKEKTLRYPGHVEYIRVLKESGFFSKTPITIDGNTIDPLEFTSKILFKEWHLKADEEEITVMKITVKGIDKNNKSQKVVYELYDQYCSTTKTSSMARTTGYTATAAVHLISHQLFTEKGIFPPELVGKHQQCFDFVLSYLKDRGVIYNKTVETI